MSRDRQTIVDTLKEYELKMSTMIDRISAPAATDGDEKERLREQMKALKKRLASDSLACKTRSDQGRLSKLAQQFYWPAIRDASDNLDVRWNTIPNVEWQRALHVARADILFYLRQLLEQ